MYSIDWIEIVLFAGQYKALAEYDKFCKKRITINNSSIICFSFAFPIVYPDVLPLNRAVVF